MRPTVECDDVDFTADWMCRTRILDSLPFADLVVDARSYPGGVSVGSLHTVWERRSDEAYQRVQAEVVAEDGRLLVEEWAPKTRHEAIWLFTFPDGFRLAAFIPLQASSAAGQPAPGTRVATISRPLHRAFQRDAQRAEAGGRWRPMMGSHDETVDRGLVLAATTLREAALRPQEWFRGYVYGSSKRRHGYEPILFLVENALYGFSSFRETETISKNWWMTGLPGTLLAFTDAGFRPSEVDADGWFRVGTTPVWTALFNHDRSRAWGYLSQQRAAGWSFPAWNRVHQHALTLIHPSTALLAEWESAHSGVNDWLAAGFSLKEGDKWRNHVYGSPYRQEGFTPAEATFWRDAGVLPDVVADFRRLAEDPPVSRASWVRHNPTQEEALTWTRAGVPSNLVLSWWRQTLATVDEVLAWHTVLPASNYLFFAAWNTSHPEHVITPDLVGEFAPLGLGKNPEPYATLIDFHVTPSEIRHALACVPVARKRIGKDARSALGAAIARLAARGIGYQRLLKKAQEEDWEAVVCEMTSPHADSAALWVEFIQWLSAYLRSPGLSTGASSRG